MDARNALNIMEHALNEIKVGKNLISWDKDISEAIKEIDLAIVNEKGETTGYKRLKNELYYLKWLIAEQT